ncbi:MAG: hypothetical protein AMXMBFR50_06050 [Ignavibacterium album]
MDSMVIKQLYVSGDSIWAATDARINTNMIAGVYKTNDGGTTWHQLDSTLGDGTAVFFYKDSERNLFYLVKGMSGGVNIAGTLYKSTDKGENWEIIEQLDNIPIDWISISRFNKNEIYARESHYIIAGWYETVYRSTDAGNNWEEITYLPSSSHGRNLTFNLSLSDSSKLFAAVNDRLGGEYFYVSTNKGNNWIYVSEPPGVPAELINDSEFSERIYTSSIYISEDGGFTWETANLGLPDTSYYLSFYEDTTNGNEIYTLRSDGLYKSDKENISWGRIEGTESFSLYGSYGFIYEDVGELKNISIDYLSNKIYVGTARGIYKKNLITDVKEVSENRLSEYILHQNHPNPFNPTTTITFQIPEISFITLKVYDILGNEINTLVAGEKFSGTYQIIFDGTALTSGVYFYVLTAVTEDGLRIREGKKMLLIK